MSTQLNDTSKSYTTHRLNLCTSPSSTTSLPLSRPIAEPSAVGWAPHARHTLPLRRHPPYTSLIGTAWRSAGDLERGRLSRSACRGRVRSGTARVAGQQAGRGPSRNEESAHLHPVPRTHGKRLEARDWHLAQPKPSAHPHAPRPLLPIDPKRLHFHLEIMLCNRGGPCTTDEHRAFGTEEDFVQDEMGVIGVEAGEEVEEGLWVIEG